MLVTRLPLSDRNIAALPLVASGQQIVRDEDLAGFFLLVGKRSKTFMVQSGLRNNGRRQTIRIKIGEVGKIAAREARAETRALLGSIADGVDPRPKPEITESPKKNSSSPALREPGSAIVTGT